MPAPRTFGRDRGLQTRMLLTLFLLGLVYAVLVAVLVAAGAGAVTVAVIAAVLFLVQYFTSDKIALLSMGAREVTPEEAPELHATIERLCIQANLPKPRVAIADTPMPNAFAVGRSPKTATVAATTGLLRLLGPAELEGVLAHELTHVQNRDVLVMTIASFFASIASFIVQMGFWFGIGSDDGDDNGPSFIVVILVSAVVYMVSFVLLQALSRYREFAADRGSAIITGRPSALSSALLKISGAMDQIPQRDMRAANGELAAFYIFPPKAKQSLTNLFATHPPLEARLEALARLESQLQGVA
ncbi:MAG: heat shock protein HtpX [Solirubrobacteraceae bacterium]|jgi:heat shock protein HtpX|nr:heat shock protein HtpX [Solirubrobacteraceae bacterium]